MKTRFVSVVIALASIFLLAACGTDEDWVIPGQPILAPTLTVTPESTASPTPALWDYTQVSCEGKPLYAWAQPGTYIIFLTGSREGYISYIQTEQFTQPIVPFTHECSIFGDFGYMLSDIPSSGDSMEWSGGCQSEYSSTQAQNVSISVIGWEDVTTRLGTLRAMRVDATNTNFFDTGAKDIIRSSEWFVCGYGLIYQEWSNLLDATSRNTFELISYTPLTTDEARVRYILADIQLGGVDGYYRDHVDAEEIAEALRRWDAGITVTNFDQFERKIVGETWQVVYAGTETLIDGNDVLLTTDPQP
jgi:hypothetical protein